MPFRSTVAVELRRILIRRFVWVLLGAGVGVCVFAGIVAWVTNNSVEPRGFLDQAFLVNDPTPALDMIELWPEDLQRGVLLIISVLLMMGGYVAGASMVGAEFRVGSVTTNLTWEPRRVRLAVAKLIAAAIVAFVASLVLQLLFTAALVPAIRAFGSFEGADADWYVRALGGVGRGALLTAGAAIAGGAIALLTRNTAPALIGGFVVFLMADPILTSWKPWLDRYLVVGNTSRAYLGQAVEINGAGRAPGTAQLYVALLVLAVVAWGLWAFRRRDVT